ncbi:hypothetical protein ACMAZF_02595 [Psychrobium sp. nBUS_13]|uniref:hypothetical protein n=1 Tax=Psychrobium sp. nBUS_13 TaxID=3395319 RepID=UPI003EB75493
MIKLFVASLYVIALLGCSSQRSTANHDADFFIFDTSQLHHGKLSIQLPLKRPKNLAIEAPNGQWFVVQQIEDIISFMPQKKFMSSKTINVKLKDMQGTRWKNGIKVTEHIFQNTGLYKFYFSDNLETEPSNTFNFKHVIFYEKQSVNNL